MDLVIGSACIIMGCLVWYEIAKVDVRYIAKKWPWMIAVGIMDLVVGPLLILRYFT